MDEEKIDSVFEISAEVAKVVEEEKKKIPGQFNLLDLVVGHVYETKHSEILGAILNYNHSIFLKSFLGEVLGLDFLKLEQPAIEVERKVNGNQIDILIKDKSFALIIENKINNAKDLNSQIERYVETVEGDKKYTRDKNIYVAYLTLRGNKKVEDKSLPKELREALGKRFLPINYHYHILLWLEKNLLQVPIKEKNIISGLWQYIDHLKGILKIRKEQKEMNDKIEEILREKLGLKDKPYLEKVAIIDKKIKDFQDCIDASNRLRCERIHEMHKIEHEFKIEHELDSSFDICKYPAVTSYPKERSHLILHLGKDIEYNGNLYKIVTLFHFLHGNSDYRLEFHIEEKGSWIECEDFNIKSDIVKGMIPEDYDYLEQGQGGRQKYFKNFKRSEYNDESIVDEIKKLSKKIDDFIENHPEITRKRRW